MQTLTLIYAVACVFGAAVVRGYGGFGFAMFAIVPLSLVLPPTQIIPSIFLMDIAAGLHLLPGVWRERRLIPRDPAHSTPSMRVFGS